MKSPVSHVPDAALWHYRLQLNLYKWILERYYSMHVAAMYVVSFHPDDRTFVDKVQDMQVDANAIMTYQRCRLRDRVAQTTTDCVGGAAEDSQMDGGDMTFSQQVEAEMQDLDPLPKRCKVSSQGSADDILKIVRVDETSLLCDAFSDPPQSEEGSILREIEDVRAMELSVCIDYVCWTFRVERSAAIAQDDEVDAAGEQDDNKPWTAEYICGKEPRLLRFCGVDEETFNSVFRRSLVVRYKASFLDRDYILSKVQQPDERGIFPKDPTLKDFLRSSPACLVTLRALWQYARDHNAADCRKCLDEYVVGGKDEGLTESCVRQACGLKHTSKPEDPSHDVDTSKPDGQPPTVSEEALAVLRKQRDEIASWMIQVKKDFCTPGQLRSVKGKHAWTAFSRQDVDDILDALAAQKLMHKSSLTLPKLGLTDVFSPKVSTTKSMTDVIDVKHDNSAAFPEAYDCQSLQRHMLSHKGRLANNQVLQQAHRTKAKELKKGKGGGAGVPTKEHRMLQDDQEALVQTMCNHIRQEQALFTEMQNYLEDGGVFRNIVCKNMRDFDFHASMFTLVVQLVDKLDTSFNELAMQMCKLGNIYETFSNKFVASGTKQLRVIAAMYDDDAARQASHSKYMSRSAELLRSQVKPGVSSKKNVIDKDIRLCLTTKGPSFMSMQKIKQAKDLRRVGNVYYDRSFANDFMCKAVASRASFRQIAAYFTSSTARHQGALCSMLPEASHSFWCNVLEDLTQSPQIKVKLQDLLQECEAHTEFEYLSIDGTVKCMMKIIGQAHFNSSQDCRDAAAIPDSDAAYKLLTVRGRTNAVLGLCGVRSEGSREIASGLSSMLTLSQRAQVLHMASDSPSVELFATLKNIFPNLQSLGLDAMHIVMVYEQNHNNKRTKGSRWLATVMNKFRNIDVECPAAAWGPMYTGQQQIHYTAEEKRLSALVSNASMPQPEAMGILQQLDPDSPWRTESQFLEAMAAICTLFQDELTKTTFSGPTLHRLLINLTSPVKIKWLFNDTRYRHTCVAMHRSTLETKLIFFQFVSGDLDSLFASYAKEISSNNHKSR
ncbi:hypothetical protein AK812_SmicGene39798 [Symbiodinium microadriaticum]|uniref:Uncharacterized protein n=1 Tax=Symbiodinium microadriaticum TaxID=2951 RepID=A0A1Q9CAB3_SYMMI|nr:hypothetical protein AK812_SmicGene39798 [Symbiodinium microadriaticum]